MSLRLNAPTGAPNKGFQVNEMAVRQIQVTNDSIQDRLILRIGTSNNEEIRVFLTRRFLRDLWPPMASMLTGHLAATGFVPTNVAADQLADQLADQSGTHSETELAGPANSETNNESTRFDQTFLDDNPNYPLGAQPLLATEAVLEASGDGSASMTLREGRERSFKLSLNAELLQALCAMLRAANEHAGWDLALDYNPPAKITNTLAPANSLLH
ncbi:MAG: hypothetical protein CVU16_06135 [Betaproteobacteria bacterium HGW-Betaproteobacteria-10]|nr:MAG: hypothetical protein CVU16_06135 [Betaproteobacteria bacterium HGW-Betaproteobacteria-10]